jgi:hypothetical protein
MLKCETGKCKGLQLTSTFLATLKYIAGIQATCNMMVDLNGPFTMHCSRCCRRKSRSQQKAQEAPEWQAIVSKLDQCRTKAYRIWVDHIVNQIATVFSQCVLDSNHQTIIEKATVSS